jgi:hypothetical protein
MNNAFYGKTTENIRDRTNVKLITDEQEAKKYYSKPEFKDQVIFNEDLIAILNNVPSVKFNKPIYTGMCVLDYSKLVMYEFYYEKINNLWSSNQIVGYDTDSFFLEIKTEDVYRDLEKIQDDLDTSDYPKEHLLHSVKNKKVIGKFKDELNGTIMTEIVFLRSKAYCFESTKLECNKKKLKGITMKTVEKKIKFDDYKNALLKKYKLINYETMHVLNTTNHEMFVKEINKKTISPFDDKRYILNDGIQTLPHTDPVTSIMLELLNTF